MKNDGIDASKGLVLVCLIWFAACILGALPFYFYSIFNKDAQVISFADAVFESASGFTTTGATIYTDIEVVPKYLVFLRSFYQWLGGVGIVVLIVAILPLFGAEGFQLYRGESTGPDKGRITARISGTAKALWLIYLIITIIQIILLMIGGLDWFEATVVAFSTMATGGFSSKNSSIAAYNSPYVEWVCIVFMFIAGFSFALIYRLIQGKGKEILKNSEARAYAGIVLTAGLICSVTLFLTSPTAHADGLRSIEDSLRKGFFHCLTLITSTGFGVDDHRLWHPVAQTTLFFLMFIGGCSGSTSGGVKVIRHVILFKQAKNEIKKQLNPSGVFSIQINGKESPKNIVHGAAGFVFVYLVLVMIAALACSISGVDIFSGINIGLLLIGNIGLGIVSGSMESVLYNLPSVTKWLLSFIMIAGRLELWTMLAIFYLGRNRLK